jgi:hypothetical protein
VSDLLESIFHQGSKRLLVGIPFVNRIDLLKRACISIPKLLDRTVLIDNSEYRELRFWQNIGNEVVYEPPVPLNFVQSMNLLQQMASDAACEVLVFMHNDAEAEAGEDERFLKHIEHVSETVPDFGVIFTNYDAMCAFNMRAVQEIGLWDNVFTQYFADNDYYRRVEIKGFKKLNSDIRVAHPCSMTIKSDPRLSHANSILFEAYRKIYAAKSH